MPSARSPLAASIAAAAFALAACGDDESDSAGTSGESSAPKTLALKVSGNDKKSTVTGPKTAEAGTTRIQVTSTAKGPRGIQLARYDEGHTAEQAVQAGGAWADGGKPLPPWVHLDGGVGSAKSGQTTTGTVQLQPGSYVALDVEAEEPSFAQFEVTGEVGDESPSAPSTITANEYSFTASGLKAGKGEVVFDNAGKEPHFIAAAPMKPDATIEDVKRFIKTEKGEPPITEETAFDTAILDGGRKQLVQVELEAGRYALLCFVPDRKGGPPHALRGMISEVEVK